MHHLKQFASRTLHQRSSLTRPSHGSLFCRSSSLEATASLFIVGQGPVFLRQVHRKSSWRYALFPTITPKDLTACRQVEAQDNTVARRSVRLLLLLSLAASQPPDAAIRFCRALTRIALQKGGGGRRFVRREGDRAEVDRLFSRREDEEEARQVRS